MTLTRAEITAYLIKHNFPKFYAQSFVDDFFDIIAESLERGEEVKFSGFGNFELKLKQERPGRNPKTGESTLIPSRKVVTFKAGNKLQERLQDGLQEGVQADLTPETMDEFMDEFIDEDEAIDESLNDAAEEFTVHSDVGDIQMQIIPIHQPANFDEFKLNASPQDALSNFDLAHSGTKIITIVPSDDAPFISSSVKAQAIPVHAACTNNTPPAQGHGAYGAQAQGKAGSTIKRHTQLGLASTVNQEMPTELMKNLDAQSQRPKQTLFSQQRNSDELYLDKQQRERKQRFEHKQAQEQLQRQEEQQAMAQEINRELELKSKRKGRGTYPAQDNQRKFEPEH